MNEPTKLSPLSVGLGWASRITSIGMGFGLPAVLGYWLDYLLGSNPLLVIAGSVIGFAAGMVQVMSLAGLPGESLHRDSADRTPNRESSSKSKGL